MNTLAKSPVTSIITSMKLVTVGIALLTLAACGTVMPKPEGSDQVRQKLLNLQSNGQLASRAPVELKEAEQAVFAAEQPEKNKELADHRVLLADRMVDIAAARAHSRLLVDQRKGLREQRDQARLDARTREADMARDDAATARNDATRAQNDAKYAQDAADKARRDAATARNEATQARLDIAASEQKAAELQSQIADLNAKATDRGLVVTLGDVLFSTNKSDLKVGTLSNLDRLVAFLIKYDDRTLMIEGHTDNTGDTAYNQSLSERRADSVMNYLLSKGIASGRLSASGKGESTPVSDNDNATGRQLNRRVEVIISNVVASAI